AVTTARLAPATRGTCADRRLRNAPRCRARQTTESFTVYRITSLGKEQAALLCRTDGSARHARSGYRRSASMTCGLPSPAAYVRLAYRWRIAKSYSATPTINGGLLRERRRRPRR